MSELAIKELQCRYGEFAAVRDFNLDICSGEFVTLLGPSGSGKTSVLRVLGGYLRPAGGTILIDGHDITTVPPQRRNIGMVFQNYALFPHMRIFDNVAFGLRVRKTPRREMETRVREALEMVQLPGVERRYPHELSGGQQQRVALARAIVIKPALLLMDEPLGALDLKLRELMQIEIKRIQRALGMTTVYVTHDQGEAFGMSDRIVVMNHGEIVSIGSPEDLYSRPNSTFTAQFVGNATVIPVEVVSWNGATGRVRLPGQLPDLEVKGPPPAERSRVFISLRPEKVMCSPTPIEGALMGTVVVRRFNGMNILLTIALGTTEILALDQGGRFKEQDPVAVSWAPEDALILQELEKASS